MVCVFNCSVPIELMVYIRVGQEKQRCIGACGYRGYDQMCEGGVRVPGGRGMLMVLPGASEPPVSFNVPVPDG